MRWFRPGVIAIGGLLFWLIAAGPLRPYRHALINRNPPQLILVLGGDVDREHIGVRLARDLSLPLIVSGGSNQEYAQWLLREAGIPLSQVQLDYRAKDTLGNFTSLVDELHLQGIQHVLLVTSEDHLPRSMAVGHVVAGSRGIRLTGIPVSCAENCQEEGWEKRIGDWLRAWAWVATGRDFKYWAQRHWSEGFSDESVGGGSFRPSSPALDPASY